MGWLDNLLGKTPVAAPPPEVVDEHIRAACRGRPPLRSTKPARVGPG